MGMARRGGRLVGGALAGVLLCGLTACSDDDAAGPLATGSPAAPTAIPTASPTASPAASPAASATASATAGRGTAEPTVAGTIATGLTSPWGLAFLPDGSALVSERDTAKIKRIATDGTVTTVGTVPGVDHGGEGGLLGIAVAPDFASAPQLYAYRTTDDGNEIIRMAYTPGGLGAPEVLVDGIDAGTIHNGGRLAFGPDGMLYVGTGEAGRRTPSQDPASLNGKILRMTPDGRVPPGNPTADSLVWSLGHRNVQGLAWDDAGRLWASEFGQNTWDELNLIEPGHNYGWPEAEGDEGGDAFTRPQRVWPTDQASPSGIAFADGSIWMCGLGGRRLWQIPLTGDPDSPTGNPRAWFVGEYGRLRTVMVAPDGSLWLMTNNTDGRGSPRDGDDRILRLVIR
jgi:glucose/arabinose dehydrogenase